MSGPSILERPASRYRMSLMATVMLMAQNSIHDLRTIIEKGEDEFIRNAKVTIGRHGFKQDDYKRIYMLLAMQVKKGKKVHPQRILDYKE